MILIFSKSWHEGSTDLVIEWLISKKAPYLRINGESFTKNVVFKNGIFENYEQIFDEANICWFRRWNEPTVNEKLAEKTDLSRFNFRVLNNFLNTEKVFFAKQLWHRLKNKEWLSYPVTQVTVSKLQVLEYARDLGLTTPKTIITSSKESLIKFHQENERIISKPISDPVMFVTDNVGVYVKTVEVTLDDIDQLPNEFTITLFQNLIEKKLELRVFYFQGEFYSMAIFSQLDKQTQIDFRNYNYVKPNRTVPYLLPELITEKLHKLAKKLSLQTGSFDLILDKNDNYIFLEVNPVGQFGMVSYPCNYNLEEKIATYLINKNDEIQLERSKMDCSHFSVESI
uniref:grasp-with-spasm system ATP-grasp peptide maturase n=1 Tax=Fulvivirga sp. TaxID=1931237 RepID=UPI00404AE0CB